MYTYLTAAASISLSMDSLSVWINPQNGSVVFSPPDIPEIKLSNNNLQQYNFTGQIHTRSKHILPKLDIKLGHNTNNETASEQHVVNVPCLLID